MASFVIDASATLPWCFRDEANDQTNQFLKSLERSDQALAPAHWPIEVGNSLLAASRRKRISRQDANRFLNDLQGLPIRVVAADLASILMRVFPLAEKHMLTLYDAAYLELAIREHIPLATLDAELRIAAGAEAVPLLI